MTADSPAPAAKPRMKRRFRFGTFRHDRGFAARATLTALAILLILVGIAGLILRVLPGWLFLAPGLVILAGVNRWTRYRLHLLLNRFPAVDRIFLRIRGARRKSRAA